MQFIKYITLVFITLLFFQESFSKGASGTYLLKGRMFDKESKQVLSNTTFYINGYKVVTNSLGEFQTEIIWQTGCKRRRLSLLFPLDRKLNKKHITLSYQGKMKKIKNKWRKYGGVRNFWREDKKAYTKDFYW